MTVKISQPVITIADLIKNYNDGGEDNKVTAYAGKLNIRPAFQRAFVYSPQERNKVMQSVYNGLPLNSMYWAKNDDGSFEVIDGQQRIISICQYLTNNDGEGNPIAINFNGRNNQCFENLSSDKQKEILSYPLNVYICQGTYDEKLDWFHTINIAGKTMMEQELRNADYVGRWLNCAKEYFSKKQNNPAINEAFYDNDSHNTLLSENGETANRQALLEKVLTWISLSDVKTYPTLVSYMAQHCQDNNADELISYYKNVIQWVKQTFKTYRKDMKGKDWGVLYNKYAQNTYNSTQIEQTLQYLYDIFDEDPDGLQKSGFYEYALSGNPTLIWHRIFSEKQQKQVYKNQGCACALCHKKFDFNLLEAHHKVAFADGGETTISNCLMICHDCHAEITAKQNHQKSA